MSSLVEQGARRLEHRVVAVDRVFTASALGGLLTGLASDLSFLLSPTLLDRFLSHPGRSWFDPRATEAHDRFVDQLQAGGLDAILADVPELAGLAGGVVERWVGRVGQMVERVAMDSALLEQRFGVRLPFEQANQVVDSAVELGDARGARVVYKSRSLSMDVAFCELLGWVNSRGPGLDLFVPRTVDRGAFGWMEHIAQRSAEGDEARDAYLTRVGMLLCLVHALGGGDVHAGNVRACGDHPVIIDSEVLLRPRRASEEGDAPSVLATGWLPTPLEIDRCGLALGLYVDRPSRWLHVGTDAMRCRPLRSPLAGARPEVVEHFRRDGARIGERVCNGFREVYDLLLHCRPPLEVFADAVPRVLLRTSYLYQETIERSLRPEALSSPGCRAGVIRALTERAPDAVPDAAGMRQAVALAERSSMDQLSVPRFATLATGRELLWGGEALGQPFRRSPLDRARRLLDRMSYLARDAECGTIIAAITSAADGSMRPTIRQLEIVGSCSGQARS